MARVAADQHTIGSVNGPQAAGRRFPRLARIREHQWSPVERTALIAALAIVMGSLFVTTYSLALGDPVPHRVEAVIVGDPAAHAATVDAVQGVAQDSLDFRPSSSVPAALHALDEQQAYAALDITAPRPTLYLSSAAGASVARLLEGVRVVDPRVQVVDTHPLEPHDPNGLDIFYLMLVATIVGFITVFQVQAQAGALELRHTVAFVLGLAVTAALVFTFVDGPLLDRLQLPFLETWGILSLHIVAVASFATLMVFLVGRWAILPSWLFFVVLGNSSSGGAVAPPLLPRPFAVISQWLPSGATVDSLRNAVYFHDYQHVQPIAVLATWATAFFVAAAFVGHRRRAGLGRR